MHELPNLKDVARLTDFSTSTVSLALRGSPKIPEATREIIRQAAQKLGYQSDPMLTALSAHRWKRRPPPAGATLALLADGTLEGQAGMIKRAATYGYRTEIFQLKDYPEPQRLAHVLFNRGILGVLVGQIFTPGFCAAFDWSRFVAVACCEGCERPPVNLVMPNHFQAMQDGWNHAHALGYRRIGLALIEHPTALDCHDRNAAFMERQSQAPSENRIPMLSFKYDPRTLTDEAAHKAKRQEIVRLMGDWLQRHQPDVVLGFNNAFLWFIRWAGWRVPEQVAFLSLWISDDPHHKAATGLALTHDEVGARAIDWLDALLRTGERGIPHHPATMSIDMVWQNGKTAPGTKPRKKRSPRPH